ncbi:MAG: CTP-dependent riboflavin kinase [Candidatus Aenigmarchaeota archaeon]|nr:CTP-dependent riboflavin kinase [Candidatus Aenigmarchaeota archaeon]
MEILDILIYLAKKDALSRPLAVTTSHVGKELGVSQQSVSRWLITLEKRGLTTRKKGIRGYIVQITPEGKKLMADMRNGLNEALLENNKIIMKGKVVSGMLEGRYYIERGYGKKIKSLMGFHPYAGTLNIRLKTMDDRSYKERLAFMNGLLIPGFEGEERGFGALKCFPCRINGVEGAVVIPERSHHGSDILETVSHHNLREKLKLSDGDDVKVEVNIDNEKL